LKQVIFVIDSNAAVQALANLALAPIGLEIKQFNTGDKVAEKIQSLHPKIVICSNEMLGLEPLALCRKLKQEDASLGFILLVSNEMFDAVSPQAKLAGADDIISKPFRSEDLRHAVQKLLTNQMRLPLAHTPMSAEIAVVIKDDLLRKMLSLYLGKQQLEFKLFTSETELEEDLKNNSYQGIIIEEQEGLKISKDLNKENQSKSVIIPRPLSEKILDSKLLSFFEKKPLLIVNQKPLHRRERTALSALIASSVFDELLQSPYLTERNWDELINCISKKILSLCNEYDPTSYNTPQKERAKNVFR
jgi:CheY-like chemotaxis protein